MKLLQKILEANDVTDWLIALGIFVAVPVAVLIARYAGARLFAALSRRTGVAWGDAVTEMLRGTSLMLFVPIAAYAASLSLTLPAGVERFAALAAIAALLLQVALWGNRTIGFWLRHRVAIARATDPDGATALSLIGFGARLLLWIFVVLLALDQFGFNITALLAGLGVGGIAVALATQNILSDLFASLSIILDKPFVVGDFIVVDNLRGNVERVGVKTTRIRSLDGELLVFSNADLLRSRIHNYQRMTERRVLFTVGVVYQTPNEKVGRITQWLREAVEAQDGTRFDRAHFKEYGDSALVFEVVYYVLTRDYNTFMDVQQAINLAIFARFAREGVDFAYPTRTLYIAGGAVAQTAS
ncbi:MAG: mechanosensitive ion channel family protein [Betaproteobacteria bacterium]|nr:mechanosensitive ion channel family protein [Betaproteobacteria bacterium]MDH3436642.1 mechanosensitive ion channel family protein [Betaproteobacteria bacterium]